PVFLPRGVERRVSLCNPDIVCRNSVQLRLSTRPALEIASLCDMTDSTGQELNLATHRAAASVWNRSGWDGTRERPGLTRVLIGIGGGALAVQGLRQRSVAGSLLAAVGGSLAWWALTGEGDLSNARRQVAG